MVNRVKQQFQHSAIRQWLYFDNGGCCIFDLGDKSDYLLGLLNSEVFRYIFGQLNPTLNFQSGEVAKFPVIYKSSEEVNSLVKKNVHLSTDEYDSYETSWDSSGIRW